MDRDGKRHSGVERERHLKKEGAKVTQEERTTDLKKRELVGQAASGPASLLQRD